MADFTMGNGTFYRNGVNFGECDILTTHSREFDVLSTHYLTSHFIGETSVVKRVCINPSSSSSLNGVERDLRGLLCAVEDDAGAVLAAHVALVARAGGVVQVRPAGVEGRVLKQMSGCYCSVNLMIRHRII